MTTNPTLIPTAYYYTPAQAAAVKGVTRMAVNKWIKAGVLKKAIYFGGVWHIEADELMEFKPDRRGPKVKG